MKKLIKGLSLLGFSVLFLAGCGKSNSSEKVGAAPMKETSAKEGVIDLKKLKPEERAQVEKVALDVKNLMRLNREADHAFQEVWEVFLNQQKSNNIFKGIALALKTGYSETGLPLLKSEDEKEQCKRVIFKIEKAQEIVENSVRFKAPQVYSLVGGECSSIPGETFIYAMKDAKGQNYFAIKHIPQGDNGWVGNVLSTHGFPVLKKAEGKADPAAKPQFTFENGRDIGVQCKMYMSDAGKLWSLNCSNLGHDDTKESSVLFEKFHWNAYSAEQTILASGLRMKVEMGKGSQVVSSFTIEEKISENLIIINEKELESGKEMEPRKVPIVPKKNSQSPVPSEANSDEPVIQSGDQAVSPDQVGLNGEIVPLDQIDTSTQEQPSVR